MAALGKRIILMAASILLSSSVCLAEYKETAVTDGGRIVGTVRVGGDVVPLPPQPVYKEQEYCGTTVTDERLVVDADGHLANVAVHVEGVQAGKPVPRVEPVRFDNRKCAFVPHVAAGSVGQTIEMHNEDPFLHDAHAILGPDTLFNLAIPKGRTVRHVLDRPGIVLVNCNVRHTWMHGYLLVTDDPYHAVTGADGRFVLDDVPPGTYMVTVWHEVLGTGRREVTVPPGGTATVDFTLAPVAPEKP